MRIVLLGHAGIGVAELAGKTAMGTARMASSEPWVCRKTWKPTAGAMPARAQASRIGRTCSARFTEIRVILPRVPALLPERP